ncbi:MAG: hypothetical protein ACSNEK_09960 [Parachlamydiaceae bacterium]
MTTPTEKRYPYILPKPSPPHSAGFSFALANAFQKLEVSRHPSPPAQVKIIEIFRAWKRPGQAGFFKEQNIVYCAHTHPLYGKEFEQYLSKNVTNERKSAVLASAIQELRSCIQLLNFQKDPTALKVTSERMDHLMEQDLMRLKRLETIYEQTIKKVNKSAVSFILNG